MAGNRENMYIHRAEPQYCKRPGQQRSSLSYFISSASLSSSECSPGAFCWAETLPHLNELTQHAQLCWKQKKIFNMRDLSEANPRSSKCHLFKRLIETDISVWSPSPVHLPPRLHGASLHLQYSNEFFDFIRCSHRFHLMIYILPILLVIRYFFLLKVRQITKTTHNGSLKTTTVISKETLIA